MSDPWSCRSPSPANKNPHRASENCFSVGCGAVGRQITECKFLVLQVRQSPQSMCPWSQRRQRTIWRRHEAQVNRRAAFLIATDENGVDPRPNAHDTAHTGRALHGSRGAGVRCRSLAPGQRAGVASFSAAQVYPRSQPGDARRYRQDRSSRRRRKSPRDGGRGLQSGSPSFRPRPPSQTRLRESHAVVCRAPQKRPTPATKCCFRPSPTGPSQRGPETVSSPDATWLLVAFVSLPFMATHPWKFRVQIERACPRRSAGGALQPAPPAACPDRKEARGVPALSWPAILRRVQRDEWQ